MTPDEILRKHEDANEMHFHEVDRKFIIEAMEEYAKEKSDKPIILDNKQQTAVHWLRKHLATAQSPEVIEWLWVKALDMEREQIEAAYRADTYPCSDGDAEQYYNDNYQTN